MKHILDSVKTIEQASADLELAVARHNFGLLHVHDIKATLNSKGIDFENECRVFEVCNPQQATIVLNNDMSLNMALPCRISVWQENGQTKIGMLKPKDLLSMLSDSDELKKVAEEVEETTMKIIADAA